jgi:hypothetical protein
MKTTLRKLTAISFVVLPAGCSTISSNHSALEYQVQKVEYNLQVNPYTALQNYLNTMSKDGWRLVQFVEIDNKFRVVMSRPKKRS